MYKTCQECGELIISRSDMGTEADGKLSADFCIRCLKNGRFSNREHHGHIPEPIMAYGVAPFSMNVGWGPAPGYASSMMGWYGVGYPAPFYERDMME